MKLVELLTMAMLVLIIVLIPTLYRSPALVMQELRPHQIVSQATCLGLHSEMILCVFPIVKNLLLTYWPICCYKVYTYLRSIISLCNPVW